METSFFRFWIRILIDKYDMISILSRFEMVNKSLARVLETDFPGGRCSVHATTRGLLKETYLRRTVESDAESWSNGVRKQSLNRRTCSCPPAMEEPRREKNRDPSTSPFCFPLQPAFLSELLWQITLARVDISLPNLIYKSKLMLTYNLKK